MDIFSFGFVEISLGVLAWVIVRWVVTGFYIVDQNERAVKTTFGRAHRLGSKTTLEDPISSSLNEGERQRYSYPQLQVIRPGGPYFKMPWEKVHKVSVATEITNMAYDPDAPRANSNGKILEAVTKDQLNTGLTGEIRYRVSEKNLYAYLFGIRHPISHIMGFFVSVLRDRIANFEAKGSITIGSQDVQGVSINDLRKNLRDLNEHMDKECASSDARYGIILEASLITGIEPPVEVESALAAINTAHNQVSSDISLAQASADQRIVESRRAVEIETLKAQAEVEPLLAMSEQLKELKKSGKDVLRAYIRNISLNLFKKSERVILEKRS